MAADADNIGRFAENRFSNYSLVGQLARAVLAEREKAESLEQRVTLLEEQLDQVLALLATDE